MGCLEEGHGARRHHSLELAEHAAGTCSVAELAQEDALREARPTKNGRTRVQGGTDTNARMPFQALGDAERSAGQPGRECMQSRLATLTNHPPHTDTPHTHTHTHTQ